MSDEKFKNIGDPITKVIEECSEVIHILCKINRFGWHNYHPNDKNKITNIKRLISELQDLEDAIENLDALIIAEEDKK